MMLTLNLRESFTPCWCGSTTKNKRRADRPCRDVSELISSILRRTVLLNVGKQPTAAERHGIIAGWHIIGKMDNNWRVAHCNKTLQTWRRIYVPILMTDRNPRTQFSEIGWVTFAMHSGDDKIHKLSLNHLLLLLGSFMMIFAWSHAIVWLHDQQWSDIWDLSLFTWTSLFSSISLLSKSRPVSPI